MKLFTRRMLFGSLTAVGLLIAGCSTVASATVPATLANAQAEATAMLQAAQTIAQLSGQSAQFAPQLAAAEQANAVFQAIPPGGSYVAALKDVIGKITPIIAVLPLPAGTGVAIAGGLSLLNALLGGLPSVAAPAPISAAVGATPVRIISAPIAIPVPLS